MPPQDTDATARGSAPDKGEVLDIQAVLNLTDKGTDPQWLDDSYGFRTNAAVGVYFKKYKEKHNVPAPLIDSYRPNKETKTKDMGEMQGPVDAAWVSGLKKFFEKKLQDDIAFRVNLLHNAQETLEREIPKVHSVSGDPKKNHELDDVTSTYVLLNLLNIKDKDGKPFPTDNKTAAGQKAIADKDRMTYALSQFGDLLAKDERALQAEKDKKLAAGRTQDEACNEMGELQRQQEAEAVARAAAARPPTVAAPAPAAAPAATAPAAACFDREAERLKVERFRWEAWNKTGRLSDHLKDEKDRDNLRDYAVFNATFPADDPELCMHRETGILHINEKGRLVYMYEQNGHLRAMDFTDERNKDYLKGLDQAMFSKDIVDKANEIYQRARAYDLKTTCEHKFDRCTGVIKKIPGTNLEIHIADENRDGKITMGEVTLVTNDFIKEKGLDYINCARAQMPEALQWKKAGKDATTLDEAAGSDMLTKLGLPANYMEVYNNKVHPVVFNNAVAGTSAHAGHAEGAGSGGGSGPSTVTPSPAEKIETRPPGSGIGPKQ